MSKTSEKKPEETKTETAPEAESGASDLPKLAKGQIAVRGAKGPFGRHNCIAADGSTLVDGKWKLIKPSDESLAALESDVFVEVHKG